MRNVTVIFSILIFMSLFVFGCAKELTAADTFIPKDSNEATAMGIWYAAKVEAEAKAKEAEARAETITMMGKFKIWCAVGMVGAVIAIAIGLVLNMKLAATLGTIGLLGCGAGYGLAHAEIVYSKPIAIVGSIFSLIVGGIVIFIAVKALLLVIKGNELFKDKVLDLTEVTQAFSESQRIAQKSTKEKPSITEKVVDKIRSNL